MKTGFTLAICLAALLCASNLFAEEKPKCVVWNIRVEAGLTEGERNIIVSELNTLLAEIGIFEIMTKSDINAMIDLEGNKQTLGCADETSCMQEITGALGAFGVEHMIYGNLGKVGSRYSMNLTLIDTGDAKVVRRATINGKGKIDALLDKLPVLAAKILGAIPPSGSGPPVRKGKAGVVWVFSKPAGVYFTRTEVTAGQFGKCVKAGKCSAGNIRTRSFYDCNFGNSEKAEHPMNCVNLHGAGEFCRWVGGRVPTEDEWYKEASNNGVRTHPWGDEEASCKYAVMEENGDGCGKKSTWPVCSKPAGNSVSGLCDMSGNVGEWIGTKVSRGRTMGQLAGGSWNRGSARAVRVSGRLLDLPQGKLNRHGFRCVLWAR